jgi:hypothetical protein
MQLGLHNPHKPGSTEHWIVRVTRGYPRPEAESKGPTQHDYPVVAFRRPDAQWRPRTKADTVRGGTMNKRGRPAKGSLVWTKSGWAARITTTVDGERVMVQRQLETTSKAAAQRKLERLLEAQRPTPEEAARVETFEEAGRRIVARQALTG